MALTFRFLIPGVFCAFVATTAPLAIPDAPKAIFEAASFQFGKSIRGRVVEHDFVLRNAGSAELRILKVELTPPLVVTGMPATLAPGATGAIRVRLDTAAALNGIFDGEVLVSLNDPATREARLAIEGQIVPAVELSPMPAFVVAAQRGESREASLEIINHEPEPLRIEKVEHASERFTTRLETIEAGKRYKLTLLMRADGSGGKLEETITVRTTSRNYPVIRIAANTYVRERVYTFPDTVDMGAIPIRYLQKAPQLVERLAQTLMVYQSGGSDFQVKLTTDLPMLDLRMERGPKGDRYQAVATLVPEKIQAGLIRGSIIVETNDPDFPRLIVPVSGAILER